jgi:hypothetical protein
MCIRVEVYLMLSKNKQVAGAIHTGSRAPHAHSHTCMQQVLLVAPPRLHALRQQAAAMLQQRHLPPEQRQQQSLGLRPAQYCLANLLPSQLRTARFRWVGYPQPSWSEAAEAAAMAAEALSLKGEAQPGTSNEGIKVPLWSVRA